MVRCNMIIVKEYRGHIRNWEELCEKLDISTTLTREERENEILVKGYAKWGYDIGNYMHGMFAFALFDEEKQEVTETMRYDGSDKVQTEIRTIYFDSDEPFSTTINHYDGILNIL